jgi:uncharacterized protein (DUF362 family)/NAD-dependent dihydropyrimidine dehydrogenase PreA subunit
MMPAARERERPVMTSVVAVADCQDYSAETVWNAVRRVVDLLGGRGRFVTAGERILVKPNMLAGDPPEQATTTHPSVVAAVVRLLAEGGAWVVYGDTPGTGSPLPAARKSGIRAAAEGMGATFADVESQSELPLRADSRVRAIPVFGDVVASDGIVSLSKLKTHALVRITGAVKNQFGCVYGLHKVRMHVLAPEVTQFGELLVDINAAVAPRLYIMDAVMAMEGNGPRGGRPRKMGVVLASTDPVALDATACRLVALDPSYVPTNVSGRDRGHGTWLEDEIDLVGDRLTTYVRADFDVPRSPARHHLMTHLPFMKKLLEPRPVIDASRCRRCGVCVEACPVPSKAVNWNGRGRDVPPVYDYGACIRCFCCQEMCPYQAIRVYTPPLGRLVRPGR